MKKLEVAALAVLMLVSVSCLFAQNNTQQRQQRQRLTAEQRAKIETDSLTKVLTLTEEQSVKLMEINLTTFQRVDSLMTKGQRSREMMEQVGTLEETKVAEVKKILDKTQLKLYKKLIAKQEEAEEERRSEGGSEGGGRGGMGGGMGGGGGMR